MSDHTFAPSQAHADLYDLAWFPSPEWTTDLAEIAQPEDWDDDGSGRNSILFNYVRYYTRRVIEEGKWIDGREGSGLSAFRTGLLSKHFEPLFAVFEQNRDPDRQPWVHREWAAPSSPRLRGFDLDALQQAVFFEDPADAVFDPRVEVVPNLEHIVDHNVDRYPAALQANDYLRKAALDNAIRVAASKARTNWRLAAPQFYWPPHDAAGRVQLLLPLSLLNPDRVDLALVLDRHPSRAERREPEGACYRAFTVLPIEWAYRNARLVTRPEAYWLDPNTRREAGADASSDDDGQGNWRPARGNDLCPICGAGGGCLLRADNRQIACRTVGSTSPYAARSGSTVWLHDAPLSIANAPAVAAPE